MDCSDGCGILSAMAKMMSNVYSPAVQSLDKWGDLDNTPQGVTTKKEFLKNLGSFTHFIGGKFLGLQKILISGKIS